ncbi:MAG TPA: hypothetical protein ENN60_01080 [archaeon]|nr:hypothetical protein [archaeon]
MRKTFVILLMAVTVLSAGFAVNVSFTCSKPCLTYLPMGSYVGLNFTVNGSQLGNTYPTMFEVNLTGADLETYVLLNESQYGCPAPSKVFGESLWESYSTGGFVIFKANLTAANTTVKVFCDSYGPMQGVPGWFFSTSPVKVIAVNVSDLGGEYVVTSFIGQATTEVSLNTSAHDVAAGRGNFSVANLTGDVFNITIHNYATLAYEGHVEIPANQSTVRVAHGLVRSETGGVWTWAVAHGNLSLVNESGLGVDEWFSFQGTKGVAVADADDDGLGEVVVCAKNGTNYQLHRVFWDGATWVSNTTVNCHMEEMEAFRAKGYNQSVVGRNATHVSFAMFNTSYIPEMFYIPVASTALATLDIQGDGYDEILLTGADGTTKLYNVSLESETLDEMNYLGHLDATAMSVNGSNMIYYDGNLTWMNFSGLPENGFLSFMVEDLRPVTISTNFTLARYGNVTLGVSVDEWFSQVNFTTVGSNQIIFHPTDNGTLWFNFTFSCNGSDRSPGFYFNISVDALNVSQGNSSEYTGYEKVAFTPETTLLANSNFTIISADFANETHLRGAWLFFPQSGTKNIQLDGEFHSWTPWKINLNPSTSLFNLGSAVMQGSQAHGNFGAPILLNSTQFQLLPANTAHSSYGTLRDLCAYEDYLVATWGNATLYGWSESDLEEIANVSGEFTECWMSDYVYLVNSSGCVEIYNYSLSSVGYFCNSSFLVEDIFVNETMWIWNGTHVGNTDNSQTYLYDLVGERKVTFDTDSDGLGGAVIDSWTEREVITTNAFSLDWLGDCMWELVNRGIWLAKGVLSRIVSLPFGAYSGSGSNLTVGFSNGTLHHYSFNVESPTMGAISNFWANVTYTSSYVVANASQSFIINFTDSGFYHDATNSLMGFNLTCVNSTNSYTYEFTKGDYHNFSWTGVHPSGKFDCNIVPVWELPLPKNVGGKAFTLYVDETTPVINSITKPTDISSGLAFNVTVNVTEDLEISSFGIRTNKGIVSVLDFWEETDEPFRIFTVKIRVAYEPSVYGETVSINMTAKDFSGKVSSESTSVSMNIYDSAKPVIRDKDGEAIAIALPFGLQDDPINVSIKVTSDAHLDYVNATLWVGGSLNSYEERTSIASNTSFFWFNKTNLWSTGEFELRINAVDVSGNPATQITKNFKRYKRATINVNGYWLGTVPSGASTEYKWQETYDDVVYSSSQSDTSPATITLSNVEVPETTIERVTVFHKKDANNYIELMWDDMNPKSAHDSLKLYVTSSTTNEYGVNSTSVPNTVRIMVTSFPGGVGSSERMCVYVNSNYSINSASGTGTWTEMSCGSTGVASYQFAVDAVNSYILTSDWNTGKGVGFRIAKKTVSSSSETTDPAGDTISTVTAPFGVATITLSNPVSKTINVSSCSSVLINILNTGTASASITEASVTGFTSSEMTASIISPPLFPTTITGGQTKILEVSYCPLVVGTYESQACIVIAGQNICRTVTINAVDGTEENDEDDEEPTGPDHKNLKMKVERDGEAYIITITSNLGEVEGAVISITYPDGTVANYTTNSLGKISFTPTDLKFTAKVFYGDETATKRINNRPGELTLGRILFDLFLVGLLMAVGIFLDEKLI